MIYLFINGHPFSLWVALQDDGDDYTGGLCLALLFVSIFQVYVYNEDISMS